MTNKLVVIINSLKVPKIKKNEIKFLVPNYSCLQNPWLGGYSPQIPVLSVLNWICWTPPPNKIPGYATVSIWLRGVPSQQNFTLTIITEFRLTHNALHKIWVFHSGLAEDSCLLGCDTVSLCESDLTLWRNVVPPSARVDRSKKYETSRTANPAAKCHIPLDLNRHKSSCQSWLLLWIQKKYTCYESVKFNVPHIRQFAFSLILLHTKYI